MSPRPLSACICATAALLAGCQSGPTKEELEAAKNTIDCERPGERIVIRIAEGEARLLMPDATRVVLYQVPTGSGFRYLNGLMELRGKGMDVELIREQAALSTDPELLSQRIDEIAATLGGTGQWIRDQQQVYGAMEDLLTEPPPLAPDLAAGRGKVSE